MAEATARSAPTAMRGLAQARALSERALTLTTELEDDAAEACIFWTLSLLSSPLGQPEASSGYGEQEVALARQLGLHGQLAYALHDIHHAHASVGDIERARAERVEAEAPRRELDNQPMLADNLNAADEIGLIIGDHARALHTAEEAHRLSTAIGNRWGLAYSPMARGTILMEGFVVRADRVRLRHLRADALLFMVRARLALGRHEQAWAVLEATHGLAEAGGTRRILWRILAAMAGQAVARGKGGEAAALRAQARQELGFIAANAGTDDLRASLLALPGVRALLNEGQPLAIAGQMEPEVTEAI
jgi:hypothetical protein